METSMSPGSLIYLCARIISTIEGCINEILVLVTSNQIIDLINQRGTSPRDLNSWLVCPDQTSTIVIHHGSFTSLRGFRSPRKPNSKGTIAPCCHNENGAHVPQSECLTALYNESMKCRGPDH